MLFPCFCLSSVRVGVDLMEAQDDKSHLAVLFSYLISVLQNWLFFEKQELVNVI